MSQSLGRLSVIKGKNFLDLTKVDGTWNADAELGVFLVKATKSIESRLQRQLTLGTFDERYTGHETNRLYLIQNPIVEVAEVAIYSVSA
jgi:hypothetical protein